MKVKQSNKKAYLFIVIILIIFNHSIVYGDNLYNSDKIEENANKLGYQQGIIKAYENNSKDISDPYYIAWPSESSEIIKEYKYVYDDFEEKYKNLIEIAYKEGFKTGYNEVIKDGNKDVKDKKEEKLDYADVLGIILGEIYGRRDFYNDNKSNWSKALPSDKKIGEMYNLNKETTQYKYAFLRAFKRKFEEGYNEGYRKANFEPIKTSYEGGYNYGKEVGAKKGEANAIKDYYLKLNNDWKRHELTHTEIIREYNLALESEKFREGFISGFKQGLSEGYTTTFQKLNKEIIQNKTTAETIPISGGEISSLDKMMSLKIAKGTYYNPVVVTIDTLSDNFSDLGKDFIKASDYYSVNIANKSYEANNKENIELKFEYYGKQDGGIYKLSNGKWLYLPSELEDGFIKTKVKPNSLKDKDNTYCVLIDKNALLLPDIRGHWAKDEIATFLRRGIVSGYSDTTFKPDRNVTRGEFLIMLSKVYNWKMPSDTQNIREFKDYNTFKSYEGVISYAINMEYISGYSDKTFRPHKSITYKEVENIMKKVTNTKNFYWHNISSKMLYEKDYRSKSYNNINNNITRAETVYMLQVLSEWKY